MSDSNIQVLSNDEQSSSRIAKHPKIYSCKQRDWVERIENRGKSTNTYGSESVSTFVDEKDGTENTLFIQSPILKTRWGFSEFVGKPKAGDPEDKIPETSYALAVEVDPESKNVSTQDFVATINDLKARAQAMAVKSASTWFPKENPSVVPFLQKDIIEKDKDETKLPQMKFDLKQSYKYDPSVPTSQFDMRVYPHSEIAKKKKDPRYEPVPVPVKNITKDSDLILMLKFEKISLYGGRYKWKPTIDHCVLYPAPSKMVGCVINPELADMEFVEREQEEKGKRSRSDSDEESEQQKRSKI